MLSIPATVFSTGPVKIVPPQVPGALRSSSKFVARDSTGLGKGLWKRNQYQKPVIQCEASGVSWLIVGLLIRRFMAQNGYDDV